MGKRILVAGGTGLIGRALIKRGLALGHVFHVLSRGAEKSDREGLTYFSWDPNHDVFPHSSLEGVDAVVNLSGYPVDSGRWTEDRRFEIYRSRVYTTALLARNILRMEARPELFIAGSAIGYYDDAPEGVYNEHADAGSGFLSRVCRDAEKEASILQEAGIRTAALRTGIVLSMEGGALKRMVTPFRFGAATILGSGRQGFPWIHIDDMAEIILHIVEDQEIRGPVNAVAPEIVDNAQFSRALAAVLRRPCFLKTPEWALKIIFGEFASTLTRGGRIIPRVLQDHGYSFRFAELKPALEDLVDTGVH